MSTSNRRKNRFAMVTIGFGAFRLPIITPLRCVHEVLEGFMDFLALFAWAGKKPMRALGMVEVALLAIKDYGPLDLVDIDVHDKGTRVRIKVLTR